MPIAPICLQKMETLLTNKTVSVTELREPRKVIDKAGSQPVAVLNRSNVVRYFVPGSTVEKLYFSACEADEVLAAPDTLLSRCQQTNSTYGNAANPETEWHTP